MGFHGGGFQQGSDNSSLPAALDCEDCPLLSGLRHGETSEVTRNEKTEDFLMDSMESFLEKKKKRKEKQWW